MYDGGIGLAVRGMNATSFSPMPRTLDLYFCPTGGLLTALYHAAV